MWLQLFLILLQAFKESIKNTKISLSMWISQMILTEVLEADEALYKQLFLSQ